MFIADQDLLSDCIEKARLEGTDSEHCNSQLGPRSEFTCLLSAEEMHTMIARGLRRLSVNILRSSEKVLLSKLWSTEYISLRDLQNFYEMFGCISGEINVSNLGQNQIVAAYFSEDKIYRQGNTIGLRGPKYFIGVDYRLSFNERITLIIAELYSAVAALESIDRESLDKTDLMPYLGILDNAKQHALTLFNTFIFTERRNGTPNDLRYLRVRAKLLDTAANLTRSFYEAVFGREFSTQVFVKDISYLDNFMNKYSSYLDPKGLKIQELDHPLKIILTSYNLSKHASIETVVGFPSGSTQLTLAVAMCNEVVNGKQPRSVNILYFPISQHSGINNKGAQPIEDADLYRSTIMLKNYLTGKNILIVDDNASTGSTISRAKEIVSRFNPASVIAGVAEMDPQRIMIRAKIASENQAKLLSVNLNHATFNCSVGVNPISDCDEQLRKCFAFRVLGIGGI